MVAAHFLEVKYPRQKKQSLDSINGVAIRRRLIPEGIYPILVVNGNNKLEGVDVGKMGEPLKQYMKGAEFVVLSLPTDVNGVTISPKAGVTVDMNLTVVGQGGQKTSVQTISMNKTDLPDVLVDSWIKKGEKDHDKPAKENKPDTCKPEKPQHNTPDKPNVQKKVPNGPDPSVDPSVPSGVSSVDVSNLPKLQNPGYNISSGSLANVLKPDARNLS